MGIVTIQGTVSGHYVYLGFAEENGGRIHVKVGRSSSPYKRFLQICNTSPLPISLFRFVKIPHYEECKVAERLLHRIFKDFRTNGEWYVFDAKIAEHKSFFNSGIRRAIDMFLPHGWGWDVTDAQALSAYAKQRQFIGRANRMRSAA